MPRIGSAPLGENTNPASTVKIPTDGSTYVQLVNLLKNLGAQIKTYYEAITEVTGSAGVFTFATKADPAHSAGQLWFSSDTESLSFHTNEADVTLNIGEEVWIPVRNVSGSTINDLTPVYATGGSGRRTTIAPAQADTEEHAHVIGLTTHQIENNSNGYVTVTGTVNGVDTDGSVHSETWVAGEEIWLSPSVAGGMTKTKPTGASWIVELGHVLDAGNSGSFLVQLKENGFVRKTDFDTAQTILRATTADTPTTLTVTEQTVVGRVTGGNIAALSVAQLQTLGLSAALPENVAIILDSAMSADGKYSGITCDLVAGTTVSFGDLCYLASADGRMELADADAEATTKPLLALALGSGTDGSTVRFLLMGFVRVDAWAWTTKGAPLFVSTTAGDFQEAAPSGSGDCLRIAGHVIDADSIMFRPENAWDELA